MTVCVREEREREREREREKEKDGRRYYRWIESLLNIRKLLRHRRDRS